MADVITTTDYPSLQCGYPSSSKTEISIVGLELRVFGLDEIRQNGSGLPVAAVVRMFIHLLPMGSDQDQNHSDALSSPQSIK